MRTGYRTKPYEKHMETFQNFSGGLNTVSPPDGMTDTELTDMLNQDIGERGSLKRRHGLRKIRTLPAGNTQGYFRYYKVDGTYDEFHAIGGKLYRNNEVTAFTITGTGITGNSFQATRSVEGVQFGGILYIATGTKLLQYDGTTCKVADPYLPTTTEMTEIGSNALADNPEAHLQNSVGLVASIDYAIPRTAYLMGKTVVVGRVFYTGLSGETYEFALQTRPITSQGQVWPDTVDQWVQAQSNGELGTSLAENTKLWKWGVTTPGDKEIRFLMRKTGTTTVLSELVMPFTVLKATDTKPVPATNTIHQCNRLLLHWDRLLLWGDPNMPATVYFSHVRTPNYFPSLMNLEFTSPKREPLTTIVHYRNSLVLFTKSSTQALYGSSPDDFRVTMLHTDLGCVAEKGAAVMKNHIGFVSLQGIYALKTIGLTDDKATVEKLDLKIDNLVPGDTNAIIVYNSGQLQVTFPTQSIRFRFYEELGSWTKDYSTKFAFTGMWNIDGEIYGMTNGNLYVFDEDVYTDDDYTYANYFETKNFSFGQPYHSKKLKELQVLTNPNNQKMVSTVVVYADESKVIGTEDSYASVDGNGNVVWNLAFEPNFVTEEGTTLGEWILGESPFGETHYALKKLKLTGKCKRTRLRFFNEQPNENHFIGFGYIFKLKKP